MAAKSVPPDEAVLAGLRKAVQALPAIAPLTGTGGVFPGGAKGQGLVEIAIAQGFLTSKEETTKAGKRAKTVVYGIITEKGIRRVLDADGPKAALEALLPAVRALGNPPKGPNAEAFRAELDRATETCVNAIKEAFRRLENQVLQAVAPPDVPAVDPAMVLTALHHALEQVKAPALPVAASMADTTSPPPTVSAPALQEAIVGFVDDWAKGKTVGCQFDVLWNHLKERYPHLTVGTFQDTLRSLHDARRIRLSGWPRMLDDMPQPQLALFVSSKVMYYAHPANPNG